MNINDLKPVGTLAQQYGVKCLAYGPPGSGKSPISATAPNAVICATEPGMLSMRGQNIPAYEAYTVEKINEFMTWLFQSNETKKFDTVCIDSISQLAEIILVDELKRNKDGRKAYGELSRKVMEIVNALYYLQNKHIYLIAKQATSDENGITMKKPFFPGQDLNIKVPHLYDEILHIAKAQVLGFAQPTIAIRCEAEFDIVARDRSGKLNKFEEPNLTKLFNKAMS